MRCVSYCSECGSTKIEFIDGTHFEKCFCENCGKETSVQEKYVFTPYERTRNAVYATGNKWAIENFNATH